MAAFDAVIEARVKRVLFAMRFERLEQIRKVVIAARLLGEERRLIEAECIADADHADGASFRRRGPCANGEP